MLKAQGRQVGVMETMDPKATDISAQLAKIKASGGDTLFVTTAVEQITLDPQAGARSSSSRRASSPPAARNSPDQLIEQAGDAANGSYHLVVLHAVVPGGDARTRKSPRSSWPSGRSAATTVGGLTEGFRGYDGITTIVEAIKVAGKAEPEAIRAGAVERQGQGRQRRHRLQQAGPAGKESGQSVPSVYLVKIKDGKVGEDCILTPSTVACARAARTGRSCLAQLR